MLYQTMLASGRSYVAFIDEGVNFEMHRHPELELSYCLEGGYDVRVENMDIHMQKGDLAVIGAMQAHSFSSNGRAKMLTLEVGAAFLEQCALSLSNVSLPDPLIHLEDAGCGVLDSADLRALLLECAMLCAERNDVSELLIRGNLYKICALILKNFHVRNIRKGRLRSLSSVETALEMIRTRYAEPLRIEDVAEQNGYNKSNFCKVFKAITGQTFHHALNQRRVEVACMLLKDSNFSVERIAQDVGFCDSKGFCRVFKTIVGKTPNTYRKQNTY